MFAVFCLALLTTMFFRFFLSPFLVSRYCYKFDIAIRVINRPWIFTLYLGYRDIGKVGKFAGVKTYRLRIIRRNI